MRTADEYLATLLDRKHVVLLRQLTHGGVEASIILFRGMAAEVIQVQRSEGATVAEALSGLNP